MLKKFLVLLVLICTFIVVPVRADGNQKSTDKKADTYAQEKNISKGLLSLFGALISGYGSIWWSKYFLTKHPARYHQRILTQDMSLIVASLGLGHLSWSLLKSGYKNLRG